ncbi:sensor histidine kinase YycG [Geobacter sp. OR-1]|uniref:ATP-binding protein n=1 Tax=Geobacter sp. OR-1 TaxID=1266765 RepID=UPI000541D77B|nr:ATP-binding protein [Geobacter sp. OR-1]GAM08484.1 sensor histidine kinase YycG [Geobacter sp. OR-1]
MGIRTKLLLSVILLLVISFSILLCTTIISVESFISRQIDSELAETLRYLQHQFYARAETTRDSLLQPVSAFPVKQRFIEKDRAWLSDALSRWHANLPFVDFITIVDSKQDVFVRLYPNTAGGEFGLTDLLKKVFKEKRPIITTEIMSRELLEREMPSSRLYMSLGKNGSSGMVITVIVPILGERGEMIGAVIAGDILNGDAALSQQLRNLFGDEKHVTVIQNLTNIVSNRHAQGYQLNISQEAMERLASGQSYAGEISIEGSPHRTSFLPILNGKGSLIGSLCVAVDMASYRNIREESDRNILASAIVALILSFGIAYFVSRRLAEPLRSLAKGVGMIEAGDLNQQVEVDSADEVGQLSRSFNSMARALAERDATIVAKTEALQQLNEQLEKRVEERTKRLQLEMGMLETILTCMAEGMVVTDRENRVIQFNPAAQKFLDTVPHRVIGRRLSELTAIDGFAQMEEITIGAIALDPEKPQPETVLDVNNRRLRVSVSQLIDSDDSIAGLIMSIREVTPEEAVDRMKADFISTVSHELKTPLTSIKGALQFIMSKSKWLTSTERELMTVCQRNTDRLIRLITDILDISKIEAGKGEFVYQPLSAVELINSAIDEIKGFAIGRSITVINSAPADLPQLFGDYERLAQVLSNLLSNAVKFSPEHKVVMVNGAISGSYVIISVTDSGRQIQWADREKLFRKFQQLERDDMGSRGGTGLGLAICKEIVERHHGKIFYETGPTGGNVFSFTVPVCEGYHER